MIGADTTWATLRETERFEAPPPEPAGLHYLLLDQLSVGVFHKDKKGRFVFVNSWFCRFHGLTAEEYLGRTSDEVAAGKWATEDTQNPNKLRTTKLLTEGARHHELIMQTGRPIEIEEQYADGDGTERWLHAVKGPLLGPDGATIGSQGVLFDITERKRTEAQLAHERDLLRALLNSSTDAIYFKDRQSRFIRCSAAMAPLFNLSSADELVGKSDFDFQGEEHARRAFEDEQEIIRTGRPVIAKTEKEAWPDGRVTWALTSKMPFYNSRGEIIGTLGISKNITAFKEAEEKVEQLHKQLVQSSRQAGMADVATSVLHNVGNVLNSVNVSTTLLLQNARESQVSSLGKAVDLLNEHAGDLAAFLAQDAKGRQFPGFLSLLFKELTKEQQLTVAELEAVKGNVDHITEIVAMQQDYTRFCGVIENVRVTDMVEDALRMNAGSLARHEVSLVREYTDQSMVSIDKHKVLQILVNLIRNAKYACDDSGREDKQIRLKVSNHDRQIRIAVMDNGIGIPPENLTRIFNHGFTTRKNGHGFGLHSGALAAKELGGALTAHSEGRGLGAVFILELPLQPPSRDEITIAQEQPGKNLAAAGGAR